MTNTVHPTAPGMAALTGFVCLCEVLRDQQPAIWTELSRKLARAGATAADDTSRAGNPALQADLAALLSDIASGALFTGRP